MKITQIRKAIFALFILSVFILGFLPVKDPDFGWHYRCGEELLKLKQICVDNHFSYFSSNYKSYNPSFIYDWLLAFVYDRFGFVGVSALGAFIFALCGFFFLQLFQKKPLWLSIAAFYAVFFLSRTIFGLGLRSQILTYLFTLVLLYLLKGYEEGKRTVLYSIPLLLLIWVNTHIGFFVGLLVIGLYMAFSNRKKTLAVLLAISFLATLINPFFWKVYIEIWRHALSPLATMIAEWAPPLLPIKIFIIFFTGLSFGISLLTAKKSVFSFPNVLCLLFGVISFKAQRNLPFFYTFVSYAILKNIKFSESKTILILSSALPLVFLAFSFKSFRETLRFNSSWESLCNEGISNYPCKVVKNFPDPSGRIFNTYEWGGFLDWQWPKSQIFVDGRMPAWSDDYNVSPYQSWLYIIQTRLGWNEILAKYHTDYLLIGNGVFLDLLLREKGAEYGWQEIYRDAHTVFYKKIV